MGFNVFASGVGKFHYSKDNCIDLIDFDPPTLLALVPSSPSWGGVAKTLLGTPESQLQSATVKAWSKMGEIVFVHNITDGIELLSMSGSGKITLRCDEENLLLPNTSGFVIFDFAASSNPGSDFIKAIAPVLKKTGLNNFGVLLQISIVLSKFQSSLPSSTPPYLNIWVSH